MENRSSLQAFLHGLIDYAGLFPPAKLPLTQAIKNYAAYNNSQDAWMLGPFVLPISKLLEIREYEQLFKGKRPLKLSIVGSKEQSEKEFLSQLEEDVKQITSYQHMYRDWVHIDALELHLPQATPTKEFLHKIAAITNELSVNVFCEIHLLKEDEDWRKYVTDSLDAIAHFNSENRENFGAKWRTGGVKAELIPEPDRLAFAISECRDRKLAMKFTAGLHHPVRMNRDEVNAKMHGFLNVFLAGMLAYELKLNETMIKAILIDEDPSHFKITGDSLGWGKLVLSPKQITRLRNSLCSFGSCSFDEPKDELRELSGQQEVTI
ncbi:hypothetical protein [Bacillus sp. B15-48]|uniref:hypothetical protein n=1 Tax=Bacillus sp. B15-48 TaxID=1548601 RepID=UPI00193FDFF4|nr:hypothetical protein [Bacillus sp. B15-48]MBM4763724.1 hypothetical protein [Bacillus sp. B15-48]